MKTLTVQNLPKLVYTCPNELNLFWANKQILISFLLFSPFCKNIKEKFLKNANIHNDDIDTSVFSKPI